MKRKLRKGCLSVLLVIGLLSGLTAQKVIIDHSSAPGCPVVDLSELAPLGAVLTPDSAHRRRVAINNHVPPKPPGDLPVLTPGGGVDGVWNAKMSPVFQVMRQNLGFYEWAYAYDGCKNYRGEKGDGTTAAKQWRLPTQRELQMIWALHPQLLNKGGFTAFTPEDYWTITDYGRYNACFISFQCGLVYFLTKAGDKMVRCVRDL